MSNQYNWNCFASQKLQLFNQAMKPEASFVHFQVKFNILIINQLGRSSPPRLNAIVGLGICIWGFWLSVISYYHWWTTVKPLI